jgi:hypothetical protein
MKDWKPDLETDRLSETLRALPAEPARVGFTQRVVARLDAPPRRAARPWLLQRWAWGAATAALLILGVGAAWRHDVEARKTIHAQEARRALDEIRAEHARLERELASLATEPAGVVAGNEGGVVYLGGNEDVDFVVDLDHVAPAPGAASPASYRGNTY